jgi:hypothetical protein
MYLLRRTGSRSAETARPLRGSGLPEMPDADCPALDAYGELAMCARHSRFAVWRPLAAEFDHVQDNQSDPDVSDSGSRNDSSLGTTNGRILAGQ